uniref:SAM domain-containing protein n=1 Tax=Cyclopterus lumpus TaxID=8103 RepID=A0A8C3AIK9_CYCLU
MAEDYHLDQSDGKRYSMDPGDSAFGSISSSYSRPPARAHSQRATGRVRSHGKTKPRFLRCFFLSLCSCISFVLPGGYSAASESQDSKPPPNKDPTTWSVDDVVWFIRDADPQALGPHSDVFRKHEIDGNALLLLKSDMIMKYLGLKLGPALKLCYHIDKLKQTKF